MKRRTFPRAFYATLAVSFLLALAFLVSTPASGQRPLPVRQDLERELDNFDQLTLDPAAVLRNVRKSGGLTLNTSRGEFEMSLEPFDVRSDDYRAVAVGEGGVVTELPRTPSHSFKGTVRGMDDTQVRFVLDGQQVEGIIVTPAETFYVEPTSHLSKAASANDFVFYAGSSVKKTTEGECATTLAQQVGSATTQFHNDAVQSSKGIGVGAAFAPEPVARLATEADFEFFQADSNSVDATNGDIANLITQVDAIYEQQLGVKLNLVFQRVWTTSNDPYTLTAANNALDEFQQKYNASFHAPDSPPSRDLVQMFTGKDLDGSTIGIAYISAVCFAPDFAFSIVQSKFTTVPSLAAERVGLSAHEMGHNFGASHPDEESPVPPSCSPSIMNSSIQNTTNFCQFSRDQMTTLVAGSSCLSRQPQFNCPLTSFSLSTASQYFPSNGGVGSIGVNAPAGCSWDVAEGASWLTVTGGAPGAGPGTPAYTVAANTGAPREAIVDVAGQKLTVLQAASNACASQQINVGQSVSGSLDTGDCLSGQPDRPNTLADLYTFTGRAGQHVKIELTASASLDTFLYLFGPDGTIVAFNDDIDTAHGVTNSRIPDPNTTTDAFFTLPKSGVYTIEATSFDTTSPNNTGGYTLALSADTASSSVSLPVNAFTVNEGVGANGLGTDGTGFRVINVTRTGDTSGTATVDYATTNGTADKHGDYEQTLGTLVFAPGVTTQSFTVFVTDDRFAEQPETVNVTLSNPVGTSLGLTPTATLTINNNPRDAVNNPSPVRWDANFDTGFFVRQQYLDFLSREPDASGFQFWSNDLNNSCGADVGCAQAHRVNVSAAFFLSIEFQETGYLVERMYKTAFGDASGNSTFPNAHTLPVPVVRLEQ
ncbi:MAG TPA: zinc-dependent metalloprotease family protein, partial [Pyrinomonadaceae bacterium]|nr:zinc-dependent metalloprotease family protein [Pyrinomonadaceae bacterium]